MIGFSDRPQQSTRPQLPAWLDRYTTLGLYGLLVGTVLYLVAFLTNPVPDPSFPWVTLPKSLRSPIAQPRIEHWPVTYTIGIWLWVFCFPALFLAGYRRYGDGNRGAAVWLVGLPTVAMLGWTTYCRFFWPKLHPPTWNAPTYDVLWSNTAYVIALFGVVATILVVRHQDRDRYALLGFGILALPLGLPALYEGYRRTRRTETRGLYTVCRKF